MPISRNPHPVQHKASAPVERVAESRLITSVRIAPRLFHRFEAYAKERGLSKSAALNEILEERFN